MSYFSDKIGLSDEKCKDLIKKGVISCKWVGYENVIKLHKSGACIDDIIHQTGYKRTAIFKIIREYTNL